MSNPTPGEKADSLLIAGDALSRTFPSESRRLLRLCLHWRRKQKEAEAKAKQRATT